MKLALRCSATAQLLISGALLIATSFYPSQDCVRWGDCAGEMLTYSFVVFPVAAMAIANLVLGALYVPWKGFVAVQALWLAFTWLYVGYWVPR